MMVISFVSTWQSLFEPYSVQKCYFEKKKKRKTLTLSRGVVLFFTKGWYGYVFQHRGLSENDPKNQLLIILSSFSHIFPKSFWRTWNVRAFGDDPWWFPMPIIIPVMENSQVIKFIQIIRYNPHVCCLSPRKFPWNSKWWTQPHFWLFLLSFLP